MTPSQKIHRGLVRAQASCKVSALRCRWAEDGDKLIYPFDATNRHMEVTVADDVFQVVCVDLGVPSEMGTYHTVEVAMAAAEDGFIAAWQRRCLAIAG